MLQWLCREEQALRDVDEFERRALAPEMRNNNEDHIIEYRELVNADQLEAYQKHTGDIRSAINCFAQVLSERSRCTIPCTNDPHDTSNMHRHI